MGDYTIYLSGESVSTRVKDEMASIGADGDGGAGGGGVVWMETISYPAELAAPITDSAMRILLRPIPRGYNGPVCLDSEGAFLIRMMNPSRETPGATAAGVAHLKKIKRLRRNVRAGFYKFPPAESYNFNAHFPEYGRHQFAAGLTHEIAREAGALIPNCYLSTDVEIPWHSGNTLRAALDLAHLYDKQVIAMVNCQYFPEASARGLEPIEPATLARHIRALRAARGLLSEKTIDGICLWQASRYFRIASTWDGEWMNDGHRLARERSRAVFGDKYIRDPARAQADADAEIIAALHAITAGAAERDGEIARW